MIRIALVLLLFSSCTVKLRSDYDKCYRNSAKALERGNKIYFRYRIEEMDSITLKHELVHVKQARRGLYAPFTFFYHIELWTRGYDRNRYENEAFAKSRTMILGDENFEALIKHRRLSKKMILDKNSNYFFE